MLDRSSCYPIVPRQERARCVAVFFPVRPVFLRRFGLAIHTFAHSHRKGCMPPWITLTRRLRWKGSENFCIQLMMRVHTACIIRRIILGADQISEAAFGVRSDRNCRDGQTMTDRSGEATVCYRAASLHIQTLSHSVPTHLVGPGRNRSLFLL